MSREADGAAASFDKIGKAAAGITAVFAAFAVNAAVKFESAMTRISTQAGVPIGQIKALSNAILGLSPKVGFNPDELANSLYHVESAFRTTGITAGKAIDIVKSASQLAKIGNADLETTTQAIIGVLASNIKGVKDAQDAAAQLNQLVGTGDTNLQTVAKSIATGILPTAATLGLSFKDVAAGLATLTDNVTPADQAARVLKTSLLTLIKPSAQQAAAFQQLGLGTLQLGEDFHKPNGLLVGVQDLKTHLDAVFPATQKTALTTDQLDKAQQSYYDTLVAGGTNAKDATKESEAYRKSIENVSVATLRANTVARALGGSKTAGTFLTLIQEIDRLKSKYDDFGTSAQAATKFQEAWANQQKTAKQKLDELKASWDVFLVQAGNAILPTLKNIVDALAKHPGIIKGVIGAIGALAAVWTVSKFASAFSILGRLTTAILGVGAASTTAAAESSAANLGAGAVGARAATGAFAAGGAAAAGSSARFSGLAASPLTKLAIPIGLVLVGADLAKSLDTAAKDIQKGHFTDGITKVLSSKFAEGFTFGISGGIAKALKSGDWLKALGPGVGLLQKGAGLLGLGLGGKLTGTVLSTPKLTPADKNFWPTLDDKARIADFQSALKNINSLVVQNSHSLVGNSYAATTNRNGIIGLVKEAQAAAAAYARTTGKQSDYTKALNLAIPAIEAAAGANGLDRQQVDNLINSLIKVPPETPAHVSLTGTREAQAALADLEANLRAIAQPINIPIQVQSGLLGVASPNFTPTLPQILTAQGSGFGGGGFGGSGPGGIPGGTGHAKGGIARGWSWIGEKGPELVNFGSPSRVLTHEDSLAAVSGRDAALVHVEHLHLPDTTSVNGFASQVAMKNHAYAMTKRV
jgi:TP901 family phage tail tape measure protein